MNESQPFYHLRPNKFIDRHLFISCLVRLAAKYPLSEYTYTGFGSFDFDDFKLVHKRLGIDKMVSLEENRQIFQRARFNRPFACIKVKNTSSSNYIAALSPRGKDIFWLDFNSPRNLGLHFADFCFLLNNLNPGSIVRITLNAHAASLFSETGQELQKKEIKEIYNRRLKKLEERIPDYLPADISADKLTEKKYPGILLESLHQAVIKTTGNPLSGKSVCPLFSTVYRDGQYMLTLTVIILKKEEEKSIRELLQGTLFSCRWDNPVTINVPPLTLKELLTVNQMIPNAKNLQKIMKKFPFFDTEKIEDYMKFYIYYPNFHHFNL